MDVWTIAADGGRQRRVTRTGDALWPVWTPDGRSIVYARLEDPRRNPDGSLDYGSSLWMIDPDGSNRQRLTDPRPGVTERPWSVAPDGSQLAITRARLSALERRAEKTRLVLIDLDGSGEQTLRGTGTDPAFSPDGSRIAYASARDRNGTLNYGDILSIATELSAADVDGSNRRRLTGTRDVNELAPSWSPDGTRLAYTRGRQYQNAEIYSIWQINPDGSCPEALLAGRPRGNWYVSPVWTPGRPRRQMNRLRCRRSAGRRRMPVRTTDRRAIRPRGSDGARGPSPHTRSLAPTPGMHESGRCTRTATISPSQEVSVSCPAAAGRLERYRAPSSTRRAAQRRRVTRGLPLTRQAGSDLRPASGARLGTGPRGSNRGRSSGQCNDAGRTEVAFLHSPRGRKPSSLTRVRHVDEEVLERLRAAAQGAAKMNWTPYTGFTVLAAVRTTRGDYHGGSNVENANVSLSKHAEETAIIQALAAGALGEGERRSRRCIEVLYTTATPCGGCRQFLSEFATEDCVVYVDDVEPAVHLLGDLLPVAFGPERHGVDDAGGRRTGRA